MNLYGFAGGDPVNFSDPFGLFPCCREITNPKDLLREADEVAAMTNRDRLGLGAMALVAAGGGFAVLAGSASAAVLATTARVAPVVAAASSKIPFAGFQAWGKEIVQWGARAEGAMERAASITAEEAAAIDPGKVQKALQFYQNAVKAGEGGAAAPERVKLMERIIDLQKTP